MNLEFDEEKKRDLYLRGLATGKLQGPLTNFPGVDKEWLKYYTEQQILTPIVNEKTIYEYMYENNKDNQDLIAINYFGNEITYKTFFKQIDMYVQKFKDLGVKEDDVVTICLPNTPEAIICFYALNKMNAVSNMIHPLSSENQIKNYVNEVNSKIMVTIDLAYPKIKNIVDETTLELVGVVSPKDSMPIAKKLLYPLIAKEKISVGKQKKSLKWTEIQKQVKSAGNQSEFEQNKNTSNKTAVILHTGGTTGDPKGVALTNQNFNSMVEQFRVGASNFKKGDKMLTIMPVFHGFGLCSSVHLPLSFGVTTILIPKLDIKNIDKLLNTHKPNHIIGVPTLFVGLMNIIKAKEKSGKISKMDLSYLKYIVSGGDLIKESLENELNEFLKNHGATTSLGVGYGLAEVVAGATFGYEETKVANTVGIPMVSTNVKIVNINTKEDLQNQQVGEICIKGPTVMKEYHDNEKATEETLTNGWLHTGDMGYIDKGLLHFEQRKGNMIVSSGVNVYPKQIEEVIEMHDSVAACAVIGTKHNYKGEIPKAYVMLKPDYKYNEIIDEEIHDLCRRNLDRYSIPSAIEYREELPQTLLGKISHAELRKESNNLSPVKTKIKK